MKINTDDIIAEVNGRDGPGTDSLNSPNYDEIDGFVDLDTVRLYDEDFQLISHLRKLSNTTTDKLVFTVSMMLIMASAFLAGYLPQYFYIIYSIEAVILIGYRWYVYKKLRQHYFLFDFCYFTTLLIFIYLWLPWGNDYKGMIFPTIFGFSNGPLLSAVVLWKNKIVPHSVDKMTSIIIHMAPSVTLWGIRWFSTEEQGFGLCAYPTSPGPNGCDHTGGIELLLLPMLMYSLWQTFYILVVWMWRNERVERRNYVTSFGWLVSQSKKPSFVYKICSVLGPRYSKHLFVAYQFLYTIVIMLLAYPCYHYNYVNFTVILVVLICATYSGASFYIDVFSRHYNNNNNNNNSKSKLHNN